MSYDVSSLFISIPIEPAIKIIQKHAEDEKDLSNRTSMTANNIICLLDFCLKNTYFSFQGRFYEQTEGAAMGSPISPLVENLFMEDLEVQAIRTSTTPPTLWKRFVDDTFTIIKKNNRDSFLQHLNSIYPNIKFTCEVSDHRDQTTSAIRNHHISTNYPKVEDFTIIDRDNNTLYHQTKKHFTFVSKIDLSTEILTKPENLQYSTHF